MRQMLLAFFLFALTTACNNEDEILPATASEPQMQQRNGTPSFVIESETFQYGSFRDMPFRMLVPRHYDSAKSYPLTIFLHGVGERGTDNESQLKVGAAYFAADSIRETYPAFAIFPQCPDSYYWFNEVVTDKLRALIDSVAAIPGIDRKNISIGGFSMGAYGTFAMVAKNPDLFRSAIAISGDGDESKADQMAHSQWRLFAGERDSVVPSGKTQKMANALDRAGAAVSFILYPEADHGATWRYAFSEPDFFDWIFNRETDSEDIGEASPPKH